MKLIDLKDANGTSLQSYIDLLTEKCDEQGVLSILVFAKRVEGNNDFAVTSTVAAAILPRVLRGLADGLERESAEKRPIRKAEN